MNILGLHYSHDASICLLKDGEIVLYTEEERISRIKYDRHGQRVVDLVDNHVQELDCLIYWVNPFKKKNILPNLKNLKCVTKKTKIIPIMEHHKMHAAVGFYNSGFKEAVCVVMDGSGMIYDGFKIEKESVYHASYPSDMSEIWKNYYTNKEGNHSGFGFNYKTMTCDAGFGKRDQGKLMGITSYSNKRIPFNDLEGDILTKMPHYTDFQNCADYGNTAQEYLQEQALKLIKYAVEKTGCKNVVLSGGFIMNVRANYYYRKNLPKDVLLYCEPLCYDGGLSMGLAKYAHHKLTGDSTIRKQETLYYGQDYSNQN